MTGPAGEAGCRVWVRAKDAPLGEFSTWPDHSGSGLTGATWSGAAQSYAGQTPNGGPAVGFQGIPEHSFRFPNLLAGATEFDIWVVVKTDTSVTGSLWALGNNQHSNNSPYYTLGGTIYESAGLSYGGRVYFTPTMSVNEWRIYRCTHDGTTYRVFLDGVEQLSTTVMVAPGFNTDMVLGSGMRTGILDLPFAPAGRVAEFFAFDTAKNPIQAGAISAYLQAEHGVNGLGGRPSPYPVRNRPGSTTFAFSTDIHVGQRDFSAYFHERAGADLDYLAQYVDGFAVGGDCIDWSQPAAPEDGAFKALMVKRRAASAKVWAVTYGNHDLGSYNVPNPTRTATAWCSSVGEPQTPRKVRIGGVNMLVIGSDSYAGGNMILSAATLAWLNTTLNEDPLPAFLLMHMPPIEQFGSGTNCTDPSAQVSALIGSHPNIVGTLSGHLHINQRTTATGATVATVAGRKIFAINGPACGGRRGDVPFSEHQFDSPLVSMILTYLGDTMEVRWRSHLDARWDQSLGQQVKILNRA